MFDSLLAAPQSTHFVLLLARLGGVYWAALQTLAPAVPNAAKVVLVLGIVAGSATQGTPAGDSASLGSLFSEMALGCILAVMTALLLEWMQLGAQVIALQSGYGFVSTIDPTSEADSGLIPTMARGISVLLFFSFGMDRHLISALARSLEVLPLGSFQVTESTLGMVGYIVQLSAENALRVSLPLVAVLLATDISLAILTRANQQLQLVSLTFPAKLFIWPLATIIALPLLGLLYRGFGAAYWRAVETLLRTGAHG